MYRLASYYGSSTHVYEFHPSNQASQIVKSPTGKRQPMSAFTHRWYIDRGYKIAAKINLGFFQTNDLTSLHNGLLARDSGFIEGVPNNGMEMWLNKDGKLNFKQLNKAGVAGIGKNWVWGTSLAFALVQNGVKKLEYTNGFNWTGKTQRTAFGVKKDGTVVLLASQSLTGDETANVMLSLGCVDAVMGDGGGSTQMEVNGKAVMSSSRPLGTMLVVFEKDKIKQESPYRVSHINVRPNTRYRAGQTVKKKYLTIHTTNNFNKGADADAHFRFLNNTPSYVSFHLVTDDKGTIELMPLHEPAYSAGDGSNGEYNVYSIAHEICCDKLDNEGKLDRNVYLNAVETSARIVAQENVILMQHRDVPERSWKNCPHAWVLNWKEFENDVLKRVQEMKGIPHKTESVSYRVQVGAFTVKEYAENTRKKLASLGYDTFVTTNGGYTRIQVGSFNVKDNAKRLEKELKAKGFDTYIRELK